MYMVNDAEDAKERQITDAEECLMIEALYLLRKQKQEAFDVISKELPGSFEERDFGIPTIDGLIKYIEGE